MINTWYLTDICRSKIFKTSKIMAGKMNLRFFEDTDTDLVRGHVLCKDKLYSDDFLLSYSKQLSKIYNFAKYLLQNCLNYTYWPVLSSKQAKKKKERNKKQNKKIKQRKTTTHTHKKKTKQQQQNQNKTTTTNNKRTGKTVFVWNQYGALKNLAVRDHNASRFIKGTLTNSMDPDETPQIAASDQGLHCLQ